MAASDCSLKEDAAVLPASPPASIIGADPEADSRRTEIGLAPRIAPAPVVWI